MIKEIERREGEVRRVIREEGRDPGDMYEMAKFE